MIDRKILLCVAVALAMALGLSGCGKSDSADSGKADGSGGTGATAGQLSAIEREAQAAAIAEVERHWVKRPEGWITAKTSGSPGAPDHYLRQIKEITATGVESSELSESDKMNGFEWAGEVSFKEAPCREAGDPGILLEGLAGINMSRQRGQWSQWADLQPEAVKLQKLKGKWQIPQDTWLLRGKSPTDADFANAGVK